MAFFGRENTDQRLQNTKLKQHTKTGSKVNAFSFSVIRVTVESKVVVTYSTRC